MTAAGTTWTMVTTVKPWRAAGVLVTKCSLETRGWCLRGSALGWRGTAVQTGTSAAPRRAAAAEKDPVQPAVRCVVSVVRAVAVIVVTVLA